MTLPCVFDWAHLSCELFGMCAAFLEVTGSSILLSSELLQEKLYPQALATKNPLKWFSYAFEQDL